jgi:hypothetical protein
MQLNVSFRLHEADGGSQVAGDILLIVLARVGFGVVESQASGEQTSAGAGFRAENTCSSQAVKPKKSLALSRNTIA